jgi:hypothetical protein
MDIYIKCQWSTRPVTLQSTCHLRTIWEGGDVGYSSRLDFHGCSQDPSDRDFNVCTAFEALPRHPTSEVKQPFGTSLPENIYSSVANQDPNNGRLFIFLSSGPAWFFRYRRLVVTARSGYSDTLWHSCENWRCQGTFSCHRIFVRTCQYFCVS